MIDLISELLTLIWVDVSAHRLNRSRILLHALSDLFLCQSDNLLAQELNVSLSLAHMFTYLDCLFTLIV